MSTTTRPVPSRIHEVRAFETVMIAPSGGTATIRQFACHVVGVYASHVALEPVDPRVVDSLPAAVLDVFLTFLANGSIIAFKGDLLVRPRQGAPTDAPHTMDIRFSAKENVHFTGGALPSLPLCAPVVLTPPDGEAQRTLSMHVAISAIVVEDAPGIGTTLDVDLSLPGSDVPLHLKGRVGPRVGDGVEVVVTGIARSDRSRLLRHVFDAHREALQLYKKAQVATSVDPW